MSEFQPSAAMILFARLAFATALGSILLLAGCSRGLPERAPVTGKITVDGKAVTEGKVAFYPAEGRPAMGEIQPDGTYRLTTFYDNDGAVLGTHKVTIKSSQVTGRPAPQSFEEEIAQASDRTQPISASVIRWIVPEEYSRLDTTPLEKTVERGQNVFDFNLEGRH